MAKSYPIEAPFRQSNQQHQIRNRLVQIVRDNPGISLGGIRAIYYEGKIGKTNKNISSSITSLCIDGRIECRPIDTYYVVGG